MTEVPPPPPSGGAPGTAPAPAPLGAVTIVSAPEKLLLAGRELILPATVSGQEADGTVRLKTPGGEVLLRTEAEIPANRMLLLQIGRSLDAFLFVEGRAANVLPAQPPQPIRPGPRAVTPPGAPAPGTPSVPAPTAPPGAAPAAPALPGAAQPATPTVALAPAVGIAPRLSTVAAPTVLPADPAVGGSQVAGSTATARPATSPVLRVPLATGSIVTAMSAAPAPTVGPTPPVVPSVPSAAIATAAPPSPTPSLVPAGDKRTSLPAAPALDAEPALGTAAKQFSSATPPPPTTTAQVGAATTAAPPPLAAKSPAGPPSLETHAPPGAIDPGPEQPGRRVVAAPAVPLATGRSTEPGRPPAPGSAEGAFRPTMAPVPDTATRALANADAPPHRTVRHDPTSTQRDEPQRLLGQQPMADRQPSRPNPMPGFPLPGLGGLSDADADLPLMSAQRLGNADADGVRPWPAFDDILDFVRSAEPALAKALVDATIPQPSPRLGAALTFLIAALRAGDVRPWIGERTSRILELGGKGNLLRRVGDEMGAAAPREAAAPAASTDWRSFTLPFLADGALTRLNVHLRDETDVGEDGRDGERGTRFVIDLDLSRLGPVQIDGLYRVRRFDLALRTYRPLTAGVRDDMRQLFKDALGRVGLAGSLAFQPGTANWMRIGRRVDG